MVAVTLDEFHDFERKFLAQGKNNPQRFGQAFLNEFHDRPEVAAHRGDHLLWEGKYREAVRARLIELNLIEY